MCTHFCMRYSINNYLDMWKCCRFCFFMGRLFLSQLPGGQAVDEALGSPEHVVNDPVLVTGGSGFIGSHLVEMLLELGYRVKVYDNLETGGPGLGWLEIFGWEILNGKSA